MSLCALHNGGGVGIGKAVNGGFGLLLDGSERTDEIIKSAIMWDVMEGVAHLTMKKITGSDEVGFSHAVDRKSVV